MGGVEAHLYPVKQAGKHPRVSSRQLGDRTAKSGPGRSVQGMGAGPGSG